MVLSAALGSVVERVLRQSLTMSLGSYDIFFTRPICAGLLLLAFAMVLWPLVVWIREKRRVVNNL